MFHVKQIETVTLRNYTYQHTLISNQRSQGGAREFFR